MKKISLYLALLCSFMVFEQLFARTESHQERISNHTTFVTNLKKQFGDISQMNIIEIGGGEGDLCQTIWKTTGFAGYTIVDSSEGIEKAKANLTRLNITNLFFIDKNHLNDLQNYDLIISYYTFSESCITEQNNYISSLFSVTPKGYLQLDFTSLDSNNPSLTMEDLIAILIQNQRVGQLEGIRPVTNPNNYLLSWRDTIAPCLKLPKRERPELIPSYSPQAGNAVTYSLSGGRLGDNLVAYFHAKWIAVKYGLPFIYKPFPYSNELQMDCLDPQLSHSFCFQNSCLVHHENEIAQFRHSLRSTLLTIPYFPEVKHEIETTWTEHIQFFDTGWDDPIFIKEIQKALTPKNRVTTVDIPRDKIIIGLHVRRGGSYENYQQYSADFPLKFPPDEYYIEQIVRMAKILKDQPFTVYVLTDDQHPERLIQTFQRGLISYPNIEFSCRSEENDFNINVLTDFFSIGKFEYFIGSGSNFSIMAEKLGNYKTLITPTNAIRVDNKNVVNQIGIRFNGKI